MDTSDEIAYRSCLLCPRRCGVDRTAGSLGYCRAGALPRVAAAVLHRGEEPPLVTGKGSGTIFFSGCTLRCASCQNCDISARGMGVDLTVDELAAIVMRLGERGASNINLVTGTHYAPSIVAAVEIARSRGLRLPVVWNSSGYESISTLELLAGTVDIWLPDVKTLDREVARSLMRAPDYPERVKEAVAWMAGRGAPRFSGDALLSGTVCRHLVLPGLIDATEEVLLWYSRSLIYPTLLSLMVQYLPIGDAASSASAPGRRLAESEYQAVLSLLDRFGIEDGFVQELDEGTDWIPDFTRPNPFPGEFAAPVWHWERGFID
jgi:putative pyruvate formate lyase activating enzyme